MEIVDGYLWITYTNAPDTPVNVGKIEEEQGGTDCLSFYPLPDGTYGVMAGTAVYLNEIVIPASYKSKPVTQILPNAFKGAPNLTSIEIPDSVTSIGTLAFDGCSSLTSIEIPDSVTSIGDYAFDGCSSLTSVVIGNSVTSIGYNAFRSCSSLIYNEYDNAYYLGNSSNPYLLLFKAKNQEITSCNIKSKTKCIYSEAFSDCSSLTSVEIPYGVTCIGAHAFDGCSNLTSVEIPNSVTSIGNYVFYDCSSLTSIEIPYGVTRIGNGAFRECYVLRSIEIPDSVTTISQYAFYNCRNLTSINFTGTKEQWKAISKGYDWNAYIDYYTIYCTDGNISK